MSLRLIGTVLGVTTDHGTVRNGPRAGEAFSSTKIHVLAGMETTAVTTGRDFDHGMLTHIAEGDEIDLAVSIFNGRVYAEQVVGRVPAAERKQKSA